MRTIRTQLLFGLLLGTLLCTLVAGWAIFLMADGESNEQSDLQLRQIAAALPAQFVANQSLPAAEDPDEIITIQVWNMQGQSIYVSQAGVLLPPQKAIGYQDVLAGDTLLRVYTEAKDGRLVQVSQPVSVRHEFAAHMVLRILFPLLFLLLALAALIYIVVDRALAPLKRVTQAVAVRSPDALQPLPLDGLSADLLPIVEALNRLLAMIERAMTVQRVFVADAAHELRSPLTALKLQLQLAERAVTDDLRTIAFKRLHDRLDRSAHLVHQLLTLACHGPEQGMHLFAPCDLHTLAQQAVIDHTSQAEGKTIDLGLDTGSVPLEISVNVDGMEILLRNLIDNALRYTQDGGRVDVFTGIEDGRKILRVCDNGPGVPENEWPRLFDRFYRPAGNPTWGSGLGMSIVKSIADQHGAQVRLSQSPLGSGLSVTICFLADR